MLWSFECQGEADVSNKSTPLRLIAKHQLEVVTNLQGPITGIGASRAVAIRSGCNERRQRK